MNDFYEKTSKRKYSLILILILVVIALVGGLLYCRSYLNYERDIAAISIRGVDLMTIDNGEYFGECDAGFIRAKVRVVIVDHKMTDIELIEHVNEYGERAEVLPERMLAEQRVDVDGVSGATSSSKVIREAVYHALTGEHTMSEASELTEEES